MVVSINKFNISNLFKFNVLSFLLAFFLSFSLIGCGGGGGGSSGDSNGDGGATRTSTISFDELIAKFSPFPSVDANVYTLQKSKTYNVTQAVFDEFNASVLDPNYTLVTGSSDLYKRTDANIIYYAKFNNTIETLQTTIATYGPDFSVLTDAVFDDEFGSIDGTLIQAFIYTEYDANISSNYAAYRSYIGGFDFCERGSLTNYKYVCQKSDDKFIYQWQEVNDRLYRHTAIAK
jgi:hypothetical protein